MSSWNIVIFGDLPKPLVIKVPDPCKWTVKELKQEMAKCIKQISEDVIILYLGRSETPVPEDKALQDCPGMKNGVGLAASIKPFIINVYCPDVDVTLAIEIPRQEFSSWKVANIHDVVCFKLGVKSWNEKDDISTVNTYSSKPKSTRKVLSQEAVLAFSGSALDDPAMNISQIPDISDYCLMTFTRFQKFLLPTPDGIANRHVHLPLDKKSHLFFITEMLLSKLIRLVLGLPPGTLSCSS